MSIGGEVENLRRLAADAAVSHADKLTALAKHINDAPNRGADPYLLIGILLEGIVSTVNQAIPEEQQAGTGLAAVRLLVDRFEDKRIF